MAPAAVEAMPVIDNIAVPADAMLPTNPVTALPAAFNPFWNGVTTLNKLTLSDEMDLATAYPRWPATILQYRMNCSSVLDRFITLMMLPTNWTFPSLYPSLLSIRSRDTRMGSCVTRFSGIPAGPLLLMWPFWLAPTMRVSPHTGQLTSNLFPAFGTN
jgi:hypothetical protein